jgi:hypothetical protein
MISTVDPQLVTAAEAARLLGVNRRRVLELATSAPDFPSAQPTTTGGHVWPRPAVHAWAAAHPAAISETSPDGGVVFIASGLHRGGAGALSDALG